MGNRTIRTNRAREKFLKVLAEQCNVSEAARQAGIGRSSAYDWKRDDEDFSAAWEDAEAEAVDKLEAKAWSRAVDGDSDRMLEILLKAHRPEKYVERVRNELTGLNGGPMQVTAIERRVIDPAN